MSLFENAVRKKVRFDTAKGQLTVEDLWDLPLSSQTGKVNLDSICVALHQKLKNGENVSFVDPERKSDPVVQLQFDVVKRVIEVKLAENAAANLARSNAEKKQRLLALLGERQDDELKNLPTEDLLKQIAALG